LKTVDEINYLSSIATAMNCQLNASYSCENQNQNINPEFYNMINQYNQYQIQTSYPSYQDSYTPDTNYGDSKVFSNETSNNVYDHNYEYYDHDQLIANGYVFDPVSNQYYYSGYENIENSVQQHYIKENDGKDNIKSEVVISEQVTNLEKNKGNKITIEISNIKK